MKHEHHHHHMMVQDFKKRFWISLVLTVPVVLLSPFIQGLLGIGDSLRFSGSLYVSFALGAVLYVYGGKPFLQGMVREVKHKNPGMMTLIAMAISVAFLYSSAVVFGLPGKVFFWELATLIVVMLLGHWLEMKSTMKASRAVEELSSLLPGTAHRLQGEDLEDVSADQLEPGDVILVRPGEKVPADGKIIEGNSSLNESLLTGESMPVRKNRDDSVVGGSVNQSGVLKVRIEKTGEDLYLSRVIDMVQHAQSKRTRVQNFADRAAFALFVVAVSAGTISLLVWWGLLGREFSWALERSVTVMVIACPHALGLAIPLVNARYTALSAKSGYLIRNRGAFEQSRNIDTVMFDKTGTLTRGRFELTDVIPVQQGLSMRKVLSLAAAVEKNSQHEIARAIESKNKSVKPARDFEVLKGKGVRGVVGKARVEVLNVKELDKRNLARDVSLKLETLLNEGKTVSAVLQEGRLAGLIALSDSLRKGAKQTVNTLRGMGMRTVLITGDHQDVAENVARDLNIDEVYASVMPGDKSAKVKELQQDGSIVAMVGDGINDAPALSQADMGIAMGSGTDVAGESADVVMVHNNPGGILKIIEFSGRVRRKMLENLGWAAGYNVIAIPLAAGILIPAGIILNPAVGAALMSLSTVVVALNARKLSFA